MVSVFKFLLARLKEPSTYAGAAMIAVSLGHAGGAALINGVAEWLVPLLGGVAVALPEVSKRVESASDINERGGA